MRNIKNVINFIFAISKIKKKIILLNLFKFITRFRLFINFYKNKIKY